MSYESLPPNQLRAARLAALGWENRAIAEDVGVETNTVYKWKCSQTFKDAVHELKLEIHSEFMSRMRGLAALAAERLTEMISQEVDNPITHADQFKALKLVFDMNAEAHRTETLMQEIEHLKTLLTTQSIQNVEVQSLPAPLEVVDDQQQ